MITPGPTLSTEQITIYRFANPPGPCALANARAYTDSYTSPLDNLSTETYIRTMSDAITTKKKAALSQRMTVLNRWKHSDNDVTERVLRATARGATLKQAAASAGLLPGELRQLFKWGEQGHPAWQNLFRKYLEISGETMNEITEALVIRAREGNMDAVKMVMGKMNPEEWRDDDVVRAHGPSLTVNLRTDFSGLYEDAVDAEVVEEE